MNLVLTYIMSEHLDAVIKNIKENFPEGDTSPNEVELAIVGYKNTEEQQFDKTWNLGIERFGSLLKSFLSHRGLEGQQPEVMITINDESDFEGLPKDSRVRIKADSDSKQVLKKFCMTNVIPSENAEYETKNKYKPNQVDMRDYGLRLRYANESKITDEKIKSKFNSLVGSRDHKKMYRYTQRYSIPVAQTDDGTMLKVDFSCVKEGTGFSFSGAQIIGMCADKVKDKYEVEIEISNSKGVTRDHVEELESELRDTVNFLVKQVQGGLTEYIVSNSDTTQLFKDFINTCNSKFRPSKTLQGYQIYHISQDLLCDAANYFIAPAIATINRTIIKRKSLITPRDDERQLSSSELAYYFTEKADGLRSLLYVSSSGKVCIISKATIMGKKRTDLQKLVNISPTSIVLTDEEKDNLKAHVGDAEFRDYIFDGELITNLKNGKMCFLTFDTILYNGRAQTFFPKAPRGKPEEVYFYKRMKMFSNLVKRGEYQLEIQPKTFTPYSPEEFEKFTLHSKFVTGIEKDPDTGQIIGISYEDNGLKYDLDGFVFQPNKEPYQIVGPRGGTWMSVYKYKPAGLSTVDLKLSYDKRSKIVNGRELGLSPDRKFHVFNADFYYNDKLSKSPHPCYAEIKNGFPRTENNNPINRGDIVECKIIVSKNKPYWEPLRVRYDKHRPNNYKIHNDVMNELVEPIEFGNLSVAGGGFGGSINVTSHNRWVSNGFIIKNTLQVSRSKTTKLLDLGCGNIKSGNAWRTIQSKFLRDKKSSLQILGVDSCDHLQTQIATCYTYMANLNTTGPKLFEPKSYDFYKASMTVPLHTAPAPVELRAKLESEEQYDIITCVFAIYYTFESETVFEEFIKNVSRNLKKGGRFICSYMNGNAVTKAIGDRPYIEGKDEKDNVIWKIQKGKDSGSPFGNDVQITFTGLYENNKEYLVNFSSENVNDIMRKHGLKYKYQENFPDENERNPLNNGEKAWARFHTNICFEKTEGGRRVVSSAAPKQKVSTKPKPSIQVQTKAPVKVKAKAPPKKQKITFKTRGNGPPK